METKRKNRSTPVIRKVKKVKKSSPSKEPKPTKIQNEKIMQIIGRLLMIEDKLFQTQKRCSDCIKEEILTIEGIVDSFIDNDHHKDVRHFYPVIFKIPDKLRTIQKNIIKCNNQKGFCKISQDVRTLRKDLAKKYYTCDKTISEDRLRKIVNHKCHKDILPVLDPEFNVREVVKNLLLLENHIMHKENRCLQCLRKHSSLIEAFLEEAITIDKNYKHLKLLKPMPKQVRNIQRMIIGGRENYYDIVKELRKMRSKLFDIAFNFVVKCN